MVILPQSGHRKVIDSSYHNVQLLVAKQKYIQHLHMLTHAEDMENLTKISTAPFILIEVSIAIPVQMVLCTNPEIYKLSIQHGIKGKHW